MSPLVRLQGRDCGLRSAIVHNRAIRLGSPADMAGATCASPSRGRLLSITARGEREAHRARDRRAPVHHIPMRTETPPPGSLQRLPRRGRQSASIRAKHESAERACRLAVPPSTTDRPRLRLRRPLRVGSRVPLRASGPLVPTRRGTERVAHPVARSRGSIEFSARFGISRPKGDPVRRGDDFTHARKKSPGETRSAAGSTNGGSARPVAFRPRVRGPSVVISPPRM